MKILFLHISDIHLEKETDVNEKCISEIAKALTPASIGSVDKIFVFVTGDIAQSGTKNQYRQFSKMKYLLINALKNNVLGSKIIHFFLVPGNHDINYTKLSHSRVDCMEMLGRTNGVNIEHEILAQTSFLKYSALNHSLSLRSPLLCRSVVDVDGFSIEINLINSTIFSLLHDNDQGLHYLPGSIIEDISTPTGAHMAITLMHHSHQWFNDWCKPQIEKALLEKNTMIFCGHEHFQATQSISYNGNSPAQVFSGGCLSNKGDWSESQFFVCIYDTETQINQHFGFTWDGKNQYYSKTLRRTGSLTPKFSLDLPQITNHELVKTVTQDSHLHLSKSLSDYYVFPGVSRIAPQKDEKVKELLSLQAFYAEFEQHKRIEISGNDTAGKTALLKTVFQHYLPQKCILFCKVDDISSGNRKRIIKTLFEDLYGDSTADFEKFERLDKKYKMILIDDLHLINPKHVESFLSGIEEDFGYILYSTSNTMKLDIEERIKSAIAKDSYRCYSLMPLYQHKRKELVERVLKVKDPSLPTADFNALCSRITQALDLQRRYVPLTPEIIIQCIEYFSVFQMESAQNDGSIFGKVFESSITNALSSYVTAPLTVDKVFTLLGKIALHVHKNRRYPISDRDISDVISTYTEEYGGKISIVDFMNCVLRSRIMVRCGDSEAYKFCNNNYLAYFIASEICATKDTQEVLNCLQSACFGIYSNILLFVTYITNDQTIIDSLLEAALSYVQEWDEFSFTKSNISHLNAVGSQIDLLPPTQEDIEKDKQADIEKDRVEVDGTTVDIVNIYDHDDSDIAKLENRLSRSISLTMLLARCLPNFEHRLKKGQKEAIIHALYTIPNRIYYGWATHVEECRDELLQLITTMETNAFVRRKPTFEDARRILQWNSISLLLELYHLVVNNAYRENTIEFLTDMAQTVLPFSEETHKLELLLVLCKAGYISEFQTLAEEYKDTCSVPAANLALTRVVHHLLLRGKVSPKQLSQIESKFFPSSKRSATLYQRKIEERKK